MKLTIDSGEPLADVLQVIGSMYGITLTTAADGSAAPAAEQRTSNRATPAKSSTSSKRRTQKKTAQAGTVDPKSVRQWASENGYEISARGSLPAAVRDAYREAHPS